MPNVAMRPDSGLEQRMHAVALDETLQVDADATIVAPAEPSATEDSRDAEKTASSWSSEPSRLPRISLGAIGSERVTQVSASSPPDIRFLKILGEGGMGRVHLANQSSLRREVAVKTLKEGANRHAHDALLSEARVTGFLAHPGIIPVHSLGLDEDNNPVLVMKRIEGVPWKELIDDGNHPGWSYWDTRTGTRLEVHLQIMMKICDAIHFAHDQKIVHRDIKPENVMLGHFGEVYLVDWGLALPMEGEQSQYLVGTPAYMAPEMALGGKIDARTDVYLLGATLHEVLTGQYLHTGGTLGEILKHAVTSEPYDYGDKVPTELSALCRLATHKDSGERPASAADFRQALADYLSHRQSVEVSSAALVRLELAEATRADATLGPKERAYDLGSHCAEARFGFQEALRTWPENEAASHGLESCLELLVETHLLRRDPVGAQAQLRVMKAPSEALLKNVSDLESELANEERDRERLQNMDKELDESLGFGERFGAFALFAVSTSGIAIWLLLVGAEHTLSNRDSVVIVAGIFVVASGILIRGRRKLLANTFNRRLVAFAMTCIFGMAINRLLGWQLHVPIRQVLIGDSLLLSACAFISGYTISAWIKWMTPVLVAGAVLMAFVPSSHPPMIFSVSLVLTVAVGGLAWWLEAHRKRTE